MLVRKISLAKWSHSDWGAEIPADAVTGDLRTTDNALSFWSVEAPSRAELEVVVLALASAAERLDKMDLSWVDPETLRSRGVRVEASDGRTPVDRLRKRHFDVARLDLGRLGLVAQLMSASVAANQHQRWTRKEVLRVLVAAVLRGELDPAQLAAPVRSEVLAIAEAG